LTPTSPQEEFARWWDATLGPGHEISGGWALPAESRAKLGRHLEELQRAGMAFVVDEFTDVGFQGGGKGAADCATGRLQAVVFG
jgi:hypothetical protein